MKKIVSSIYNNAIDQLIGSSIRRTIMDWPLDFGVETAVMNGVSGDYHEFGVYQGRSFIRVAKKFRSLLTAEEFSQMTFWAYDSFEGLPETKDELAPAHFVKGAYSAPRELFENNCRKKDVPMQQLEVVHGFYEKTLVATQATNAFESNKISVAYIDCDVYESAVPIFEYITQGLQTGTVLVIDDWIRHCAHPDYGIQRAFNEWLARNPSIKLQQVSLTKRICFVVYEH